MTINTIHLKHLNLESGDRLLDLGCGLGRHLFTALQYAARKGIDLDLVGLDYSHQDLCSTQQRSKDFLEQLSNLNQLQLIQGNGLKLPFQNASFDKLICSEVIEHILPALKAKWF